MSNGSKTIAYLTYFIRGDVNRTQYQRAKWICKFNDVLMFLKKETQIPEEIEKSSTIYRCNIRFTPLFMLWRLLKVVAMRRKVDIVYTFYMPRSILEGFVLKLLGFRWVTDIWDHPALVIESKKKVNILDKIFLKIAKRVLRCADLIILAIKSKALDDFELVPEKIVRVTNGVDLNRTEPKGICQRSKNFINIFYVGYVMKERGIDTLLSAISQLKMPVTLTLVGDMRDVDREWFERTVRELKVEDKVRYLGVLDNEAVLELEECSDICVYPFPKLKELDYIYPIKVFEYMAMGKAIIATDLEGIRQIIKDGFNGILVRPNDSREMAEAIYELSKNPKLRKKLGHNARKTVKKYDWSLIHMKINAHIRKVG